MANGEEHSRGFLRNVMRLAGRTIAVDGRGENTRAVHAFRIADALIDAAKAGPLRRALRRSATGSSWPAVRGAYCVGDAAAYVAACTLTSNDLMAPFAELAGVAIAGRLYTVNLGIERLILNVTANPRIRFLILCGKDSPVFRPAEGFRCLCGAGVDSARRIIGATGPVPVLDRIEAALIERFRRPGQTDRSIW
jgi:tetrahydromethanopterin S-methyltransferase subunit A